MKRLVVVCHSGLSHLRRRSLRLDELASAGLDVEYWDLSGLYGRSGHGNQVSRPYVRSFESWASFDAALTAREMRTAIVVPAFPYYWPKTLRVFLRLSKSPCSIANAQIGLLPTPPRATSHGFKRCLSLIANPQGILSAAIARAAMAGKRLGFLRDFDVVLAAGAVARQGARELPVVAVHQPDYDDWIHNSVSDRPPVEGSYGVFLDELMVDHPDYAIEGVPSRIEPSRYYSGLNDFLDRLEQRYGLPIVIAAHPKADYAANPYEGRTILFDSTRRLVRWCRFAITSFSTSTSYAVLGSKPLFFLESDDMLRFLRLRSQEDYPRHLASILGARLVHLDRPSNADVEIPAVNDEAYDAYRFGYLVSREVEDRCTSSILSEFLRGEGKSANPGTNSRHC